jgi:hypothetical protein
MVCHGAASALQHMATVEVRRSASLVEGDGGLGEASFQ